jgi:hypothetical protein
MLLEAFGGTDETQAYVNLSDGGHFDNLGLYEMVRRRCRFILVCDAGQDGQCRFDDLGTAIRNVRVDLGVSITFRRRHQGVPEGLEGPRRTRRILRDRHDQLRRRRRGRHTRHADLPEARHLR